MTVEELIQELSKFPGNFEVFTKKTDAFGDIGCIFNVSQDTYSSFGHINQCVIISDMSEDEDE